MKIDLVVQAIPPVHDAIGEYTACLAKELSLQHRVRILTSEENNPEHIDCVPVEQCFRLRGNRDLRGLLCTLLDTDSNVVILQYNPFAWGRRGWAFDLVKNIREFARRRADVCLCVMFHETFMMNPGFRPWVMRLYQKMQFDVLRRLADICFFSTGVWAEQSAAVLGSKPCIHLPVGANIPESSSGRQVVRRRRGIAPDDFVCGFFGSPHPTRQLSLVEEAVEQISAKLAPEKQTKFLHVGGTNIDWQVTTPAIRTGRLGAADASDAIACMDVLLNPFRDGLSTRRGSAIAALQNGVPLLSTIGVSTDDLLRTHEGKGIFLAAADKDWSDAVNRFLNSHCRNSMQLRLDARNLFENHFAWTKVSKLIVDAVRESL